MNIVDYDGLTEAMREMLVFTDAEDPSQPYWKIMRIEVQPETDNMGAWIVGYEGPSPILYWAEDEAPMGWKDPDPLNPPGTRDGAYTQVLGNVWGGFGVKFEEGVNAESVFGFGLYGRDLSIRRGHHPVLIFYELYEPEEPPPPPPPDKARFVSDWRDPDQIQAWQHQLDALASYLTDDLQECIALFDIETADD